MKQFVIVRAHIEYEQALVEAESMEALQSGYYDEIDVLNTWSEDYDGHELEVETADDYYKNHPNLERHYGDDDDDEQEDN